MLDLFTPEYSIYKADKQDILNLKISAYKLPSYSIQNYFTYYYDYNDEQYLSFDCEKFIYEQVFTEKLDSLLKNKYIHELSFNDKKDIYENVEIILYRLNKISFLEYFGTEDMTYNLTEVFFKLLDIKIKYVYLYILLLHTNQKNDNNIFFTPVQNNAIINYKLFEYLTTYYNRLSINEIKRISQINLDCIEIDLKDSIQEITSKIKILKKESIIKLKINSSDRKKQISLALKILYSLNNDCKVKQEIMKMTVQLGHIYKIDNYDVSIDNVEEEYIDWERIFKNSRLFKETLKLFDYKYKEETELPF